MLREATLAHAIQHREHGMDGAKVLLLNNLLEELLVFLSKFRDTCTDGFFRIALGHPKGNVTYVFTNVCGTLIRIVLQRACLGLGSGFLHGLALNRWQLISFARHLLCSDRE
jgi:hypothetical protein